MRRHPGIWLITIALLGSAPGSAAPAAQAATADGGDTAAGVPREYQVKAAFVDRFLNFVEWSGPKADADTLVIGVVGDSPMAAALETIASGARSRPVVVRTAGTHEELAMSCRVIFVSATIAGVPRADSPQWGDTAWTAPHQVLTIGEDDGFTASGGVIGFYTEDDRLRFAVSEGATAQAGLTISSKLLRLAKIVP